MDMHGDFETHLTMAATDGEALATWAEKHGVKYSRILLDRGREPDQPMLTVRGKGSLDSQRTTARDWARRLREDGFTVVRVKIEASPFNPGVPQSADEASTLPAGCYFEHHVKLALADESQVDGARTISEGHTAHVSRNARRVLQDGRHERFVTQRCYGVGRPEARRRLEALVAELSDHGYDLVETEEEFVVVDDNPGLDHGWIDEA